MPEKAYLFYFDSEMEFPADGGDAFAVQSRFCMEFERKTNLY